MSQSQGSSSSEKKITVIRWAKGSGTTPHVTQEEAEANLHHEGYDTLCWYDVPGVSYPEHAHDYDECLWILRGEFHLTVINQHYVLNTGDRIYLPTGTPHTVGIPDSNGVTYLIGQKR
jgi:mannose-6-phosphate isomerase-like protein (cupin superfamily)